MKIKQIILKHNYSLKIGNDTLKQINAKHNYSLKIESNSLISPLKYCFYDYIYNVLINSFLILFISAIKRFS